MLTKLSWDDEFHGALDVLGLESLALGVFAELTGISSQLLVNLKAH